ncbi:multidrug resistance-associated ABC transporter [Pholiota conissans]|uniref:Multidrug resistance-associated ABC transporter n=1 Tax=Pholiota conissans TaxID=109636 RepID=A0A9P5YVX6_9AGAR|nr:multidrug resistance-associated ABC transporter [Pholiota conissans]
MINPISFAYQVEPGSPYHLLSVEPLTTFSLNDVRSIPLIVVAASFGLQAIFLTVHGVKVAVGRRKCSSIECESNVEIQPPNVGLLKKLQEHIAYYGGCTIIGFMLARLIGSAILLYLSWRTLQKTCHSESPGNCPEAFLTTAFLYSTILGLMSVLSKTWSISATRHNIIVLLSTLTVYLYRDIWPLATYDEQPEDTEEGSVLMVKIVILAFIGVVIPLVIPRRYTPVDPKDPMPAPNPEQTASVLSLMTFTFLDPVVFLGYKVPHLSFEQLPPLADYDSAKYLMEKAFPHIDLFAGARPRHLFFRLMRVFIKQYTVLFLTVFFYSLGGFVSPIGIYKVLNYLETNGEGQTIRPWIWIIWLFLGPMLQSVCIQWYTFTATHVLALCEALITELVFEHSLRIRFKAETSNKAESRVPTNDLSRTESIVDTPAPTSATNSDESSLSESTTAETSTLLGSTVRDPSMATSTSTLKAKDTIKSKGKQKELMQPQKVMPKKKSDRNLTGRLNNLVTSDLKNITIAKDFLFLLVGVPLNIGLCLTFLYRLLGWSTFVGLAVMIALLPFPGYMARKVQQVQSQRMKLTDARVQAVSEAMSIIRMVKLFGWENRMLERLKVKRDEELKLIWKLKLLNCASSMVGFTFPTFTMVASYGVYTVVMKKELTPSIIFSTMAVFTTLRGQVLRLMRQTVTLLQGKVSLDRLDEFLRNTEMLDSFLEESQSEFPIAVSLPESRAGSKIGFHNASFSWSLDEDEDSGIVTPSRRLYRLRIEDELLFKRDAINLIIGPTGSGKTSILMALLGEMHFIPMAPDSWFNLPRNGGIAYAAQESWVQNDTIRNNILFGSQYDEARYQKVIRQCALEQDLEMFDAGDATEVGERGLTLSGGQKARLTLARAIYSPAEILLLDDVLAALDVHTSTWIVDKCFRGDLVKNRTILLVTHNVALAGPIADFVVSIGIDGRIKSQGTQISVALSRDSKLAREAEHDKEIAIIEGEVLDDNAPAKKAGNGKLMIAEEIVQGHVTWRSFKLLFSSLGGDHPIMFFSVIVAGLLLNEWTYTFQVWFIGYWGSQYEHHPASEVPVYLYLLGYTGIILLFCAFFSTSFLVSNYGAIRSSRVIHTMLIDSILGSTLRWLDETPVGRIITRCTQDITAVDGPVPNSLLWLADAISGIFAKLGAVILFTPIFLWPGLAVAFVGLYMGNMYLKAQLSVKRETSNARAPVLSHFTASIHGIVSIRAYGAQDRVKAESLVRINHYTRVTRMSYNLGRWIGFRIDLLGAGFTAALASYLIYGPHVGTANTGFSLNMALQFTQLILRFVRLYNDFEVEANSLERIQGYIDIEHEPKPTEEGKPPAAWPTSGELRIENLSARYSRTGPKVLHDISFTIASGERVGVVGRTGSGKSSLILALLRCVVTEGEVFFDGRPTSKVNLDALRTTITIIPQTPELLSGTLRENLDPFDQHDDATLNAALQSAGLFSLQQQDLDEAESEVRLGLDSKIASGGGNLSVGERQIIALARAMVRGSKLLMLDEATSAIDYKTDSIIQNTLRTQLPKDVTVITVAHRLQTIMDSDKILVLDNGRIAEYGKPIELLAIEKGGMLRALVDESGDREKLYELAQGAYRV